MMSKAAFTSGSLRYRLAVTLIGVVAVLTLLFYFVLRAYAAQIALQSQDNILNASVTAILDAAIIRDGVVKIDIPYAAFSMLNTETDDRVFYAIYQNSSLLSGYADLPFPQRESRMSNTYKSGVYLGVAIRQVTASRVLVGGDIRTRITATVAQTQDSLSGILQRIARNAALYGVGFFSLAVVLAIWATSSTIDPLKRLAESVARRGPQDLSPIVKPVPSEMTPLVSSLNSLMTRLDKSFSQSEEFIAEAAHRVRTPLATVRSHAEVTLQRVDKEENRQALRSMIRAIDESSRAAGQLLDHAMITFRANQLEYQAIDLVELARECVQRLTPMGDMRDVELRLETDTTVLVSGDAILIQNAVRNLMDNALKYSPVESVIIVKVRSEPSPHISIIDQGAGFPSDEMHALVARFTRGRNASGTIGSGLGLTIAQDVALAHDGTLNIGNTTEGGACVTFSF